MEKIDSGTFGTLYRSVMRILRLNVENARIITTQKLTVLFSSIAYCTTTVVLVFMAVVFASIAVGYMLSRVMSDVWAFLIIAGFYLLVAIVLMSLRKQIFIDPIARFMSRLLLDPPTADERDHEKASADNSCPTVNS